MSVEDHTLIPADEAGTRARTEPSDGDDETRAHRLSRAAVGVGSAPPAPPIGPAGPPAPPAQPPLTPPPPDGPGRRRKPRLRKLRLLLTIVGFVLLALASTVFGMAMSVTADLPALENRAQFALTHNSYLYDDHWRPIGMLEPPNYNVIDSWQQISPAMVHAIVAVEDKRFWTDPGIDLRGIARAFVSDITGGPHQGASTIAEQFVKNVLAEQSNRTIFEKLREAALAFQLVHRWPRWKILTQYLNTIYFGEGAYGIESAARVYFGSVHGYQANNGPNQLPGACGDPSAAEPHRPECAQKLTYWEAALLAGMVANPAAFDPIANPHDSMARRNFVLLDMLQQRYISRAQYEIGIAKPLPTENQIQQPQEPPAAPYFTSWLQPQIIAALEHEGIPSKIAPYKAYYGGLRIRTTIDLQLQQAAQQTIDSEFPPGSGGPTASLVTIDNHTGEVRAMVSGNGDYAASPFNLATLGHRQPGSSFKPFTLAEALRTGEYGPYSLIDSAPQNFIVPHSAGKEHFIVHNFGNTYSGPISLAAATAISDNSVYAQVGIHVGTKRVSRLARAMGIRSPVSDNYAMILGGLKIGVSPLDMAHAYETLATGGLKVYNPLLGDMGAGINNPGPTGIAEIKCPVCPLRDARDRPSYTRVLPAPVAAEVRMLLEGVVAPGGTGALAAIPGVTVAGKTGTTTDYADAWFVGWTPQLTTAVWVGYPSGAIPMTTAYNGQPVEGGTYPALIWNHFMVQALQILAQEQLQYGPHHAGQGVSTTTLPVAPATGVSGAASSQPALTTQTAPAGTATNPRTNTAPAGQTTIPSPTATTPGGSNTTPAPPPSTTTPAGGSGSGTGGAGLGGG